MKRLVNWSMLDLIKKFNGPIGLQMPFSSKRSMVNRDFVLTS